MRLSLAFGAGAGAMATAGAYLLVLRRQVDIHDFVAVITPIAACFAALLALRVSLVRGAKAKAFASRLAAQPAFAFLMAANIVALAATVLAFTAAGASLLLDPENSRHLLRAAIAAMLFAAAMSLLTQAFAQGWVSLQAVIAGLRSRTPPA